MVERERGYYRPNVGLIVANQQGRGLLWCRRVGGRDQWQFPQGGIGEDETPSQAAWRELQEEVGLSEENTRLVAVNKSWIRYRMPTQMRRGQYMGQVQRWFLFQMKEDDSAIDLATSTHAEFDDWQWVSYWFPLMQVVDFKRESYRRALLTFMADYGVIGAAQEGDGKPVADKDDSP